SAAALFDDHGGSKWLALGQWHGSLAVGSDDHVSVATDFEIALSGVDPSSKIELAAVDISGLGDAFEALRLTLEKNGVALGDTAHFASVDAVRSFFEDTVIDLGTGLKNGDSLLAHFDFQGGAATSFGMGVGFAMIVPEPGTAALLIAGLVLLAHRRPSWVRASR